MTLSRRSILRAVAFVAPGWSRARRLGPPPGLAKPRVEPAAPDVGGGLLYVAGGVLYFRTSKGHVLPIAGDTTT